MNTPIIVLRSRMILLAFGLETCYSGNKNPLIPLLINYKFISNFNEKVNLFNNYFVSQCTCITDTSVLPITIFCIIETRLAPIYFDDGDVLKIIRSDNVNKDPSS